MAYVSVVDVLVDNDVPTELPPYRGVLVVDTKGFGANSDVQQEILVDTLPEVVWQAFDWAGLPQIRGEAVFPHLTGDGIGLGFDAKYLPWVVGRYFDALQAALAERDKWVRSHGTRLRMRASVHVGPVRVPEGEGEVAVVGSTVITTHRLLDTGPVRDLLSRSDPDQTFLSVIISQRVFDDVVASGLATLPESRLVARTVTNKEFTGTAYLYVPNPSGDLLRHGFGADPEPEPAAEAPARTTYKYVNRITGGTSGTTIQVGRLHGGVHGLEQER